MKPTPDADAREVVEELDAEDKVAPPPLPFSQHFAVAQASLSARRATPSGTLRITASVPFGRLFVGPVVTEFLAAHPQNTAIA